MSVPLLGAKRLRELLDENDVRPSKALGQNFVIDPNTIRKMVEIAGVGPGDSVLEIGAGAGSLTLGLAATGASVTAVELDRKLLPVINEVTAEIPSVTVVHADALEFDFGSVGADRLVANLPYNIATQVVLRAAEFGPQLERMTVMTQREVGERLAADPGSKVYGLTTVLLAYFGSARVSGRVSRNAFYPVPNVDSVIVSVERHDRPPVVDRDALFTIARAAFAQRRKTLRRCLVPVAGSLEAAAAALAAAGIHEDARAEDVPFDGFVTLANVMSAAKQGK
jgi:16S rRNA (adenine1518-N6/adenine1519-N6)-dimethyltransferase